MKKIVTVLGVGLLSFFSHSQTAVDFEETSAQYIDVGTSINATLTGTNALTTEAWVKLESAGTFRTIIGNYNGGMQFLLRIDNGKAAFWVDNGGGYTNVTGTTTIPVGTWTHIAGSWDGTDMKVYVNGVLENTVAYAGTLPSSANPVRIGNSLNGSEYMDGLIDQLRVWNVTRTDAEILANMNNCLGGAETGLLALYDFETGSGATLFDKTGNGYNGNFVNSPVWATGYACVTCNTISDQTVNTADFSKICSVDTTIEIASSEVGINYFLRDNADNSIVDGPIAGTGSAITFNAGTVSSTTTYNVNAATNSGGAVNFDGVDDYIDLGTSSSLDIQGDITVETWVKLDAYQTDWVRLVGKGQFTTNRTYGLWLNGSGTLMWQMWGTSNIDFYGPTLALNTWYHVAVTRSGSNLTMYLNGVQVASNTYVGTPALTAESATIGSAVTMHAYLDGQMDDVRIWNVARTATEIQENMNVCLSGNETGLVTSLDLNDGTGTTAVDLSPNGLNGTLTNGPTWVTGSPNVYCSACDMQMTATPTITINPIADQTVTATSTDLCLTNTGTTITTASSETGVVYYLRDDANDTLVDGPIMGTGSGLTFNTGVLPNTTTYNVYAKKEGKVLDFDGVDDYITANNLLTISNNFTYEVWVNPTSTITLNTEATSGITGSTGQKYVVYPNHGFDAYGSSNDAGVGLSVGTNGVSVYEHTSGYLPALLVYPTTITDWTHIAVVCTNKQYTLYINGVLVKTGQTSLKTNVHPNIGETVSIQNNGIGGGDYGYYQGSMDDFRLWDYARTSAEIQSSLLNCITGTETGLVAAYDFEDGTGASVATDKSTNNYNSTLTNMDVNTDWLTGLTTCSCTAQMSVTPTVLVQDVVAPVADAASLTTLTDECSVSAPTAPTATDACEGTITGTTTTTFPITTQGTTVVTWTYDDGNGNTSTQTQNVVITDVTAPVADNATLLDLTDQCSVNPTAPTATDNCAGALTGTPDVTFPMTTSGMITWTFDDGNGNTTTQTQNVTINDNTAPVADAATLLDLTDQCSVSPTAPTATDNCAGTLTGTPDVTFPMTTSGMITWTFDDGNGNTTTQTQNVTINDNTAPVPDVTTLITSTAECEISLIAPTATDNCVGTVSGTADVTFPYSVIGTSIITWTYDDGNGNTVTQTQEVVVTDSEGPVADVATLADVTATCEVTSLTDPTATDNCSANVTVTNDATLPINTVGTTVVTWTYDDGNGNTSTQTQNVIVSDPNIDVTTTTTGVTITANNTAATSYQWIDCNNSNLAIAGETNVSFTATVDGDYAVVITEGNCSDTSMCIQIAGVGIDDNNGVSELVELYPNPNNGEFTISTAENNVAITIYSIDGKVIVNNLKITEANQLISLGDIESGVYLVKVMTENNQKTMRLVVE